MFQVSSHELPFRIDASALWVYGFANLCTQNWSGPCVVRPLSLHGLFQPASKLCICKQHTGSGTVRLSLDFQDLWIACKCTTCMQVGQAMQAHAALRAAILVHQQVQTKQIKAKQLDLDRLTMWWHYEAVFFPTFRTEFKTKSSSESGLETCFIFIYHKASLSKSNCMAFVSLVWTCWCPNVATQDVRPPVQTSLLQQSAWVCTQLMPHPCLSCYSSVSTSAEWLRMNPLLSGEPELQP